MLFWFVMSLFLSFSVFADSPVIVFGEAQNKTGSQNEALVEMPESDMPQGPFFTPERMEEKSQESTPPKKPLKPQKNIIDELSPQDPPPFFISPEQEKNKIENTLYEGGNRIYDVQSYPLEDIKTITEPNVDPTITTYPEY